MYSKFPHSTPELEALFTSFPDYPYVMLNFVTEHSSSMPGPHFFVVGKDSPVNIDDDVISNLE